MWVANLMIAAFGIIELFIDYAPKDVLWWMYCSTIFGNAALGVSGAFHFLDEMDREGEE